MSSLNVTYQAAGAENEGTPFSEIKYFSTWSKIAQNYDPDDCAHFASHLKTNGNRKGNLGLKNRPWKKYKFMKNVNIFSKKVDIFQTKKWNSNFYLKFQITKKNVLSKFQKKMLTFFEI